MILSKKRARVDNDSGILPLATPELRGARSPATRDDRMRKPIDGSSYTHFASCNIRKESQYSSATMEEILIWTYQKKILRGMLW